MHGEKVFVKIVFTRYHMVTVDNRYRLHLLTERIASLHRASVRKIAAAHELKLAQLEALIYLSVANRYSNTPIALVDYFGVTKGTISQTLKALERRALIEKHSDVDDGRVQRCHVTKSGMKIVREAYPADQYKSIDSQVIDALTIATESHLEALQQANEFRTFGQCNTCQLFQARAPEGLCDLTGHKLSAKDSLKICREHKAVNSCP